MARERLILAHKFALGDSVLLSGLCRDIQLTYPGRFELLLDVHFRDVFENNPHARCLTPADKVVGVKGVKIRYADGIRAAGRGMPIHMLSEYYRSWAQQMRLPLTPLLPHGDIHLTAAEKRPLVEGRYWVVMAGGKIDITTKIWWAHRYQEVVDALAARGIRCAQAGALHKDHRHPRLTGVVDMLGKGNTRHFLSLIYGADGVIGPVTAAMHIAACFQKPAVVLCGGREEPFWELYATLDPPTFGPNCAPVKVPHTMLHTIGMLDCCKTKGCWKHRTLPLNNRDQWDVPIRRCKLPVVHGAAACPRCLDMISADTVVNAVMKYYTDGQLPPISQPLPAVEPQQISGFVPPAAVMPAELPVRAPAPPAPAPATADSPIFDHGIIGGRFTVFVLCYGPHADLARRCIESLRATLPRERRDLRVGLNAACPETRAYIASLGEEVTKVYDDDSTTVKYPRMRQMFWDPACPVTTPYLAWFDDDVRILGPDAWLQLGRTIVAQHPHGARLFGWPMFHDTAVYMHSSHDPTQWFKHAAWWRGRDLRLRDGRTAAPNGTVVNFVPGWAWALAADTMRIADIPDVRLHHNGGDVCIGEQVHHAGGSIGAWNTQKKYVWTAPKSRRGFSENFPWAKP